MQNIVNLLFEAKKLKDIPRSGYQFLETGKESVAEHSFMIAFIAFVMSQIHPEAEAEKLVLMCLFHDLPEARTGDLNYVQKRYVTADEDLAIKDLTLNVSFGTKISELITEFNTGITLESQLAKDADQLALILELKSLADGGHLNSKKWIPHVVDRLETDTGKTLSKTILQTDSDAWWFETLTGN